MEKHTARKHFYFAVPSRSLKASVHRITFPSHDHYQKDRRKNCHGQEEYATHQNRLLEQVGWEYRRLTELTQHADHSSPDIGPHREADESSPRVTRYQDLAAFDEAQTDDASIHKVPGNC